jgi:hypothetical protein
MLMAPLLALWIVWVIYVLISGQSTTEDSPTVVAILGTILLFMPLLAGAFLGLLLGRAIASPGRSRGYRRHRRGDLDTPPAAP